MSGAIRQVERCAQLLSKTLGGSGQTSSVLKVSLDGRGRGKGLKVLSDTLPIAEIVMKVQAITEVRLSVAVVRSCMEGQATAV